jgi:hypothetical protein
MHLEALHQQHQLQAQKQAHLVSNKFLKEELNV